MKKSKIIKLSAAGNNEPPAFFLIKEMGFLISKEEHVWIAENESICLSAASPLELLGLITLYQIKGENWKVSDEKIDEYVRFDSH